MAYGPRHCACCGDILGVEEHHLYLRADGCPDDLTVWLCHHCHGRAHGMRRRINIRERTIAGLAAAKARGVNLGSFGKVLAAKNAAAAAARDETLRPVLTELAGMSANAIAVELNTRKVPTPNGGSWSASTVIRVQRRLGATS